LSLTSISCKKAFLYNLNEVRLEENEKNLNAKNIEKIEAKSQGDTLKFILIGDSQRFYNELDDFVEEANKLKNVAFVILAGDISDFGLNKEFKWIHRSLSKLYIPYIAVIGNHDMLANGRIVYQQMFGPENFTFTSNGNKFICLNTNSEEVGYNGSLPNIPWLQQQLSDLSNYKNAFVISHVPPFNNAFDKKLEKQFSSLLSTTSKVRLSLHGHLHSYQESEFYNDGLKYVVVGTINKRNYALISVWGDQHSVEEVYY
jgi:Icc-related predicted phosphoesterase